MLSIAAAASAASDGRIVKYIDSSNTRYCKFVMAILYWRTDNFFFRFDCKMRIGVSAAESGNSDTSSIFTRDRPKPVFLVSAVVESGAVTEVQLWP